MKIRVLAGLALGSLAFTACSSATPATTSSTTSTSTTSTAAAPAASTPAAPAASTTSDASAAPSEATTTTASPTAAAPAGSVAGTLTIWADDKRAAALKDVAAQFGKDKNIQVNVQAVSKDLQAVFVTASQAGNAPDVVVGAHDWIGNLVQNSTISPVTIADKGAFDSQTIEAVTYDGQTYGVPYMRENIALIRNTDLAADAPKTLDDLVSTGQKLKKDGKVSQIMALQVGQTGDAYHMMPLMSAGGGSFFKYDEAAKKWDPNTVTLDSADTIKAMEKIKEIGEKGSGALTRSIGGDNSIATFTSKKTAFLVAGPWAVEDIKKAGIKYDITQIPTWSDGGKPAAQFSGTGAFFVASKGKNALLAQEFVNNYVSKPETQVALYKAEPRPPALTAALNQVKGSDTDLQKWADAGKNAIPMPAIPAMGKVWEPLGKAEAAIVGGADVTTTMKAAAETLRSSIKG